MSIQNQLVLDHFYISLNEAQFSSLLPLTQLLKSAVHMNVQSSDDHWEGIFIRCRTGSYFEILKERRPGGMGIALSPIYPHYTDASRITEDLPDLSWRSGTRTFPDGQPWYDWYSLGDYLDVENTVFNAWLMKYHLSHREHGMRPSPRSIDRFDKLELELGNDHVDMIKDLAAWLPGERFLDPTRIEFSIPDRDGDCFHVSIKLIPGDSRFRFKGLTMDLARGVQLTSQNLGDFEIKATKDTIRLIKMDAR